MFFSRILLVQKIIAFHSVLDTLDNSKRRYIDKYTKFYQ